MKVAVVIEVDPEWERFYRGLDAFKLDLAGIIRECVEYGMRTGCNAFSSRGHVVSCEIVKEEHDKP